MNLEMAQRALHASYTRSECDVCFLKVELLVEYGADMFIDDKTMDEWGSKAIHDAKTMGMTHVVAFLEPIMARVSQSSGDKAGLRAGGYLSLPSWDRTPRGTHG